MPNPECSSYRWRQHVTSSSSPWSLFPCWMPVKSCDIMSWLWQRRVLSRLASEGVLCSCGHSRNYWKHTTHDTSTWWSPGLEVWLGWDSKRGKKTERDHAYTFPGSLFSSSFMNVSSYSGLVHDSKELSGEIHWPLHTGVQAAESHFHVRAHSASWFLGGTEPQSRCPLTLSIKFLKVLSELNRKALMVAIISVKLNFQ